MARWALQSTLTVALATAWTFGPAQLMLVASPVHASPKSSAGTATTPGAKDKARALFAQGQTAYEAGDFAAALSFFEQAHATFPAPALFFNMAQCLRKLNQPGRALEALQKYIDADKNMPAKIRVDVDLQMDELRVALEAEQRRATEAAAAAEAATQAAAREKAEADAAARRAEEAAQVASSTTASSFDAAVLIGAVAGGVAVIGTTLFVIAMASTPPLKAPTTALGTVDLR